MEVMASEIPKIIPALNAIVLAVGELTKATIANNPNSGKK